MLIACSSHVGVQLSDAWVFGAPSDPLKLSRMRAWQREVARCERAAEPECARARSAGGGSAGGGSAGGGSAGGGGSLGASLAGSSPGSSALYNASRLALKGVEHTWGLSIFHYGPQKDAHWANADFAAQRRTSAELQALEASWMEQRRWALDFPLEALGEDSPLARRLRDEWAALEPRAPPQPESEGFEAVARTQWGTSRFALGSATLRLDERTGALASLVVAGREWAAAESPVLLLQYQTLVYSDFQAWWAEYLVGSWGQPSTSGADEYGKPAGFMHGLPDNRTVTHQLEPPSLVGVWRRRAQRRDAHGTRAAGDAPDTAPDTALLLELRWAEDLHVNYGAPASAWVRLEAAPAAGEGARVEATISIFNKTATRLPEALYVSSRPAGSAEGRWTMDVLGSAVDPLDVAEGAARGMHAVSEGGVQLICDGSRIRLGSLDAAVVRWDAPLPFPTPLHRQPDLGRGVSYVLHDNIWNTNYPAWYPFDQQGTGNLAWRFSLEAGAAVEPLASRHTRER